MSGQCYNFNAFSHDQLYEMIHNHDTASMCMAAAPNTAGTQQAWQEFAALMADAEQRVQTALQKAGVEWEGAAAEQMHAGVAPMGDWAGDTHAAGSDTHSSVVDQTSAYNTAQRTMPHPVQVSSTANSDWGGIPGGVTHLFGGQTDQDQQEAAAKEAKAQAVRVMTNYEASSYGATSSVGTFTAPPAISGSIGTAPASASPVGGYSGGPGAMGSGYGRAGYGSGGGSASAPGPMNGGPVGPVGGPPGGPAPAPRPAPVFGGPAPAPIPTQSGGGNGWDMAAPLMGGIALGGGAVAGGRSLFGKGGKGLPEAAIGEEQLSEGEEQRLRKGAMAGEGEGRLRGGLIEGEEESMNRRGAGGAGARGVNGENGAMAGGRGGRGEEDGEHKPADYLEETADVWGDDRIVAPSVIGE